jgi:hypothetical protein
MDALEVPSVEPLRGASSTNPSAGTSHSLGAGHASTPQVSRVVLSPRMNAALAVLVESLDCASDLDVGPWEFAVELSSLRRLKLSNSDLRWMVMRGLIEHAVEITPPGDCGRSFRQSARLEFNKRTCFILSAAGVNACRLRRQGSDPTQSAGGLHTPVVSCAPMSLKPNWDRDRKELRVGLAIVKRFTVPAVAQETVLAAFEERHWPPQIDDPWAVQSGPSTAARLQQAIAALNQRQKQPLVRFSGDGSGQGVRWQLCSEPRASES